MTDNESENVLAMATDTSEHHLLAGDTIGYISIFFIQDYCSSREVGPIQFSYYHYSFMSSVTI